jgi:hypothetical protein
MPDEARIVYLLMALAILAPAGVAAVRYLFRKRR